MEQVQEWSRGENGGGGIMVERGADGEGSRWRGENDGEGKW